jgi:hypothetical protein
LDNVTRGTTATEKHCAPAEGKSVEQSTTLTAAEHYSEYGKTLERMQGGPPFFTISTAAANNVREKENVNGHENAKTSPATKDPLRMFGLLTPPALRQAQSESIKFVEDVIPRLVSIDNEMKEMEIRIRRARKYKGKAEAKEGKEHFTETVGGEDPIRDGQRQEVVS